MNHIYIVKSLLESNTSAKLCRGRNRFPHFGMDELLSEGTAFKFIKSDPGLRGNSSAEALT